MWMGAEHYNPYGFSIYSFVECTHNIFLQITPLNSEYLMSDTVYVFKFTYTLTGHF